MSYAPVFESVVPALIGLLKDREGPVRASTAMALGRIGPAAKDSVPALTKLLQDKEPKVRHAAKDALDKIQ